MSTQSTSAEGTDMAAHPAARRTRRGWGSSTVAIAAAMAVVIPVVVTPAGFDWAAGDTTPPELSAQVFGTAMGYAKWVTLAGAVALGVLVLLITAVHVANRRRGHVDSARLLVGFVVGQSMWVLGCMAVTATIASGLAGVPA